MPNIFLLRRLLIQFLSQNELLAPMAAYDTHANQLLQQQAATIANAYARRKRTSCCSIPAQSPAISSRHRRTRWKSSSLRCSNSGWDPNPNRDQIMRLFSGDGTQPASTAGGGGDSTTETADDLDPRRGAVRDGLIQRGMQPGRRHRSLRRQRAARQQAGQSVHRRARRGGLARDFSNGTAIGSRRSRRPGTAGCCRSRPASTSNWISSVPELRGL